MESIFRTQLVQLFKVVTYFELLVAGFSWTKYFLLLYFPKLPSSHFLWCIGYILKNLMKLLVIYLFFVKSMSAENICGIVWRYRPQRAKGFSLFGVFYCIYIYTYVALLKIGLLGWGIGPSQGVDPYIATQTEKKGRPTSIPTMGFEATIPMSEQESGARLISRGQRHWLSSAKRLVYVAYIMQHFCWLRFK